MLQLNVALGVERFDDEKEEFIYPKEITLQLEHSLISISKWESKWHKPFLVKKEKTTEELMDYIRCMTLTKNVDPMVYEYLTAQHYKLIEGYIHDSMTATTFSKDMSGKGGKKETVTSELIYYWMFSLGIPMECQQWHINRLLTLVEVFNRKNAPSKKMSKQATMSRYSAMNAARKRK